MKMDGISRVGVILVIFLISSAFCEELGVRHSDQELKAGQEIGLKFHNIFRKWHKSPDISLDEQVNKR